MKLKQLRVTPLLILLGVLFFCASGAVPNEELPPPTTRTPAIDDIILRDIGNASKIINDNDLVLNLTHFQLMDQGGKKYYLLEKESISYMIQSVTLHLYQEIILVNREGTVVFTMHDDRIFAKNIKGPENQPSLSKVFSEGMRGAVSMEYFICDAPSGDSCRYIASPLVKNGEINGVIVFKTAGGNAKKAIAHKDQRPKKDRPVSSP